MRRRFQFSLRWLIAVVLTVCLVLGVLRLPATQGQYIEGGRFNVGEPVRIKGQLVQPLGPRTRRYWLDITRVDGLVVHAEEGVVSRCWLWLYPIEIQIEKPIPTGEYTLILHDPDLPQKPSLRGTVSIRGCENRTAGS